MLSIRNFVAGLAVSAALSASSLGNAQTLQVSTVGSSAQFGVFAAAAYKLAGTGAKHYTIKGNCGTLPCAYVDDQARNSSIPNTSGTLFVVWNATQIWTYLSVDSVVGVRAFMAAPRALLVVSPDTETGSSGLVSPSNALNVWPDASTDQPSLPVAVWQAITGTTGAGVAFTAANTDIRPEDALFATNRALASKSTAESGTGQTTIYGLGYESGSNANIGVAINSSDSASPAYAVAFSIDHGTRDPFSSQTSPQYPAAFLTVPVGAAPITFLVNRSSSTGFGYVSGHNFGITNINAATNTNEASAVFGGTKCNSTEFGPNPPAATFNVDPILREPTSGTMNTVEFSGFLANSGQSQETGVSAGIAAGLPIGACTTGGTRYRGIGTGDAIALLKEPTVDGTKLANAIAYTFFNYEATDSIAALSTYGYLQADSSDPIKPTYGTGSTAGEIPTCHTTVGSATVINCAATVVSSKYDSFANLRSGTYKLWSEYRVITDANGLTNAKTLVNEAQNIVDTTLPDFVPFSPQDYSGGTTEPGLDVYRSHFTPFGVTLPSTNCGTTATHGVNDGPIPVGANQGTLVSLTLGGDGTQSGVSGTVYECGGDVGGAIQGPFTANPTYPGTTGTQP